MVMTMMVMPTPVDARNNKTGPHLSSDEDRRNNGEKTR